MLQITVKYFNFQIIVVYNVKAFNWKLSLNCLWQI